MKVLSYCDQGVVKKFSLRFNPTAFAFKVGIAPIFGFIFIKNP